MKKVKAVYQYGGRNVISVLSSVRECTEYRRRDSVNRDVLAVLRDMASISAWAEFTLSAGKEVLVVRKRAQMFHFFAYNKAEDVLCGIDAPRTETNSLGAYRAIMGWLDANAF